MTFHVRNLVTLDYVTLQNSKYLKHTRINRASCGYTNKTQINYTSNSRGQTEKLQAWGLSWKRPSELLANFLCVFVSLLTLHQDPRKGMSLEFCCVIVDICGRVYFGAFSPQNESQAKLHSVDRGQSPGVCFCEVFKWSEASNVAMRTRSFTSVFRLWRKEALSSLQAVITETYRTTEKWADRMENRIVEAPRVILWGCGYFWVQATTEDDIN